LQHAFLADNLLGLVYKIVKGTYDSIPSVYSDDMREVVDKILSKDESQRPTVQEILLMPYLKAKMEEFILNQGDIGTTDLKVRAIKPEEARDEEEKELLKGLTGSAYLKKKKELAAQREADRIKEAMKGSYSHYGAAKERKYNEFYTSKGEEGFTKPPGEEQAEAPVHATGGSPSKQFQIDPNSASSFGVNDRYEDTYELSNSMGTQISQLTEHDRPAPMGPKKFSNYHYDDREIKASGSYKFEEHKQDDEDYLDDFEDATRDENQMTGVLDNYRRILSGDIHDYGEDPLKKHDSEPFSPISEAPSADEFDPGTIRDLASQKEQNAIREYFGDENYEVMYDYLLEARRNNVDDATIQDQLKKFVGPTNKEALSM